MCAECTYGALNPRVRLIAKEKPYTNKFFCRRCGHRFGNWKMMDRVPCQGHAGYAETEQYAQDSSLALHLLPSLVLSVGLTENAGHHCNLKCGHTQRDPAGAGFRQLSATFCLLFCEKL